MFDHIFALLPTYLPATLIWRWYKLPYFNYLALLSPTVPLSFLSCICHWIYFLVSFQFIALIYEKVIFSFPKAYLIHLQTLSYLFHTWEILHIIAAAALYEALFNIYWCFCIIYFAWNCLSLSNLHTEEKESKDCTKNNSFYKFRVDKIMVV